MDKIDHLLDAIEHPENYSDSEIETLLQDPETRKFIAFLIKPKRVYNPNHLPMWTLNGRPSDVVIIPNDSAFPTYSHAILLLA